MTKILQHTEGYEIPTPTQIQKFLKSIDYPVSKHDICTQAMENGVDKIVLTALAQIDATDYDSPSDVSRALTKLA